MRSTFLLPAFLFGLTAGAIMLPQPSNADARVGADREVSKEEVLESLKNIGTYSVEKKDQAAEELADLSDRVAEEIVRMQADIDKAGDDATDASKELLSDMKDLGATISERADEAADTSAEGWAAFQKGFASYYSDLKNTIADWWN